MGPSWKGKLGQPGHAVHGSPAQGAGRTLMQGTSPVTCWGGRCQLGYQEAWVLLWSDHPLHVGL